MSGPRSSDPNWSSKALKTSKNTNARGSRTDNVAINNQNQLLVSSMDFLPKVSKLQRMCLHKVASGLNLCARDSPTERANRCIFCAPLDRDDGNSYLKSSRQPDFACTAA